MPYDIYSAKRKKRWFWKWSWWSWDEELIMRDHNDSFHKISFRVEEWERDSILNRIVRYSTIRFTQKELPILHQELKVYRDKLDTKELERVISLEEMKERFPTEFDIEFVHRRLTDYTKITEGEKEHISKLIKEIEKQIGKPDIYIVFKYTRYSNTT